MTNLIESLKTNILNLPMLDEQKDYILKDIVEFSSFPYTAYLTSTSLESYSDNKQVYYLNLKNNKINWEKAVSSRMQKGAIITFNSQGMIQEEYLKLMNNLFKSISIIKNNHIFKIYQQKLYYEHNILSETYYLYNDNVMSLKKYQQDEEINYILKDDNLNEKKINQDEFRFLVHQNPYKKLLVK